MKKFLVAAAAGAALMGAAGAANAALLYQLDVVTSYGFSYPGPAATNLGGLPPSPDTGFVTFINSGPTAFVGTLGDLAVANNTTDYSQSFNVTLNPGQAVYFSVADEASNVGGFNGLLGIDVLINGVFGGVTSVHLDAHDGDIHSGSFQTNPFGVSVDSFVLQGGDPQGRDTGDAFEVNQAHGNIRFSAVGGPVPEPATWAMMLMGFFGLGAAVRSRKALAA